MNSTVNEAVGGNPVPASHVNNLVLDLLARPLGVRHTVVAGAVDGTGRPNVVSAGAGLSAVIAGALALAYASGTADYLETLAANTTVSSLTASSKCFLYVDRASNGALTAGFTTFRPIYQPTTPAAGVRDDSSVGLPNSTLGTGFAGIVDNNTGTYAGTIRNVSNGEILWQREYLHQSMGATQIVTKLSHNSGGAGTGVLEYSQDGETWASYGAGTVSFGAAGPATTTLTQTVSFRFLRLRATGTLTSSVNVTDIVITGSTTSGSATGQYWFDTANMKGYTWSGAAWVATDRVFVGEAVTGAGTVSSVVTYAFNGRYDSGLVQTDSGATTYSVTHNLGVTPGEHKLTAHDGALMTSYPLYWATSPGSSGVLVGGSLGAMTRYTASVGVNTGQGNSAPATAIGYSNNGFANFRLILSRGW